MITSRAVKEDNNSTKEPFCGITKEHKGGDSGQSEDDDRTRTYKKAFDDRLNALEKLIKSQT